MGGSSRRSPDHTESQRCSSPLLSSPSAPLLFSPLLPSGMSAPPQCCSCRTCSGPSPCVPAHQDFSQLRVGCTEQHSSGGTCCSPWSLPRPRAACPWPCSGDSRALPAARNPSAPHRDAPGHAAGTPLLWVQQTGGPGVGLSAELKHTSYSDMYEMQLTAEFSAQERSPETLFPF